MPKVTIVIPTLNSARTLKRCLTSVENLDYPKERLEVIVVDGDSNDSTVEAAYESGAKVIIEPGSSRGGACNIGARVATGTIVAFTDADATVPPTWMSSIVREMAGDPPLDAIGGLDIGLNDQTHVAETVSAFDLFRRMKKAYSWKAVFKIKGVNSAYRTRSFLELGGFDAYLFYGEESEFHARMVSEGRRIMYTPDIVVLHERHEQNLRSLARSFRTSRLLAPLLFRTWTVNAALRDITSPLTTLLFLFLAICLGIPLLAMAFFGGYLPVFLLFATLSVFTVCNLYAFVIIRRRRGVGRTILYFATLGILPIQTVLRAFGVTIGALELLAKRILGEHRPFKKETTVGKS